LQLILKRFQLQRKKAAIKCAYNSSNHLTCISARQHTVYSALCHCPSVRPSVCHTGGSVKDSWR